MLIGAVTTGIAGSFPSHMCGALAFSFFSIFLLLSMFYSVFARLHVRTSRRVGGRCMAGGTVPLSIEVQNTGKRELFDVGAFEFRLPDELKIESPIKYVSGLEVGQSHTFEYPLAAKKRGVYQLLGASALSAFPFGFSNARRFTEQFATIVVYPSFMPLKQMNIPAGSVHQPGGLALTNRLGHSTEFMANRDYQPGDRIRDLHPRSWARVGFPVVKQYQEEFMTRVALVVDTFCPKRRFYKVMEANLSLAASVTDYLSRSEAVIDVMAVGSDVHQLEAHGGSNYFDEVLDILASVGPSDSDPLPKLGDRLESMTGQLSAVIMLFMHWDESRLELVTSVRERGVRVKPIVVGRQTSREPSLLVDESVQFVTLKQVLNGIDTL